MPAVDDILTRMKITGTTSLKIIEIKRSPVLTGLRLIFAGKHDMGIDGW